MNDTISIHHWAMLQLMYHSTLIFFTLIDLSIPKYNNMAPYNYF